MIARFGFNLLRAPLEPACLALEPAYEAIGSPLALRVTAPCAVTAGDIKMEAVQPWSFPYRIVRVAMRLPPECVSLTTADWRSVTDGVVRNMTSTATLDVPIDGSPTASDALTLQTLVRYSDDPRYGRCVLVEIPVPADITLRHGATVGLTVVFAGTDLTLRISAAGHIHSPRCNHAIVPEGDVWRAAYTNDVVALEAALAAGGSTEETYAGVGSALAVAARCCLGAFHILLAAGADVTAKDADGLTPLHNAARHGHVAIVQALLRDARVNPGERDGRDRTPLHWAAAAGRASVVLVLLGDPRVRVGDRDNKNMTPLDCARLRGYAEVVRMLESPTASAGAP